MGLQKLDVYRVRNIKSTTIFPSSSINLIYGDNGSGKSALMEAIFILGRARSFRTAHTRHVINIDDNDLLVFGQCWRNTGHADHIGVKLSGKSAVIHINNSNHCKRADLAYAFPVQCVHPKSYILLDGGSSLRREFIDWGLFHQDPHYLSYWKKFKRCLLHRNSLLKSKQYSQIVAWDNDLLQYANLISNYREHYILQLDRAFQEICMILFSSQHFSLKFFCGWEEGKLFPQILKDCFHKDCYYGTTHYGPHRSDFYLMFQDKLAKDFISRGQQKLFLLALKLAQIQLLPQHYLENCCFLFDDFASELDIVHQSKMLDFLANLPLQVFLTANDLTQFGNLSTLHDYKMFHVEHGVVSEI